MNTCHEEHKETNVYKIVYNSEKDTTIRACTHGPAFARHRRAVLPAHRHPTHDLFVWTRTINPDRR